MRLYDELVQFSPETFEDRLSEIVGEPAYLHEALRRSVRVDVNNVSEYIYSSPRMLAGLDIQKDLPVMAAPFPMFWMEWRVPRNLFHPVTGELLVQSLPVDRFGVLCVNDERPDEDRPDVLQVITGWMFGQGPHGLSGPFLRFMAEIGLDGGALGPIRFMSLVEGFSHEEMATSMGAYLSTAFVALGFMNCKNVVMEDAPDTRTRQQRRYDERKGTKPTEFKTLVIEPMKRVLKTEGGSEQHGLKKALHICRGHFSTYTAEKPLFGKYSGTFWIPAHVRGSADVGEVRKDYRVKAGAA